MELHPRLAKRRSQAVDESRPVQVVTFVADEPFDDFKRMLPHSDGANRGITRDSGRLSPLGIHCLRGCVI
jgi:hypothetical protein